MYRLSGGREYHSFDATFVRVIAHDDTDGWGESTAQFDAPVRDGGVIAPDAPGLGIAVDRNVLGEPLKSWS